LGSKQSDRFGNADQESRQDGGGDGARPARRPMPIGKQQQGECEQKKAAAVEQDRPGKAGAREIDAAACRPKQEGETEHRGDGIGPPALKQDGRNRDQYERLGQPEPKDERMNGRLEQGVAGGHDRHRN
jgi:hypothetical protein